MKRVVNEFGTPDVLINDAGTMIRKDVLKLSIAEIRFRDRRQSARDIS